MNNRYLQEESSQHLKLVGAGVKPLLLVTSAAGGQPLSALLLLHNTIWVWPCSKLWHVVMLAALSQQFAGWLICIRPPSSAEHQLCFIAAI